MKFGKFENLSLEGNYTDMNTALEEQYDDLLYLEDVDSGSSISLTLDQARWLSEVLPESVRRIEFANKHD
jgi:hypothetical protein